MQSNIQPHYVNSAGRNGVALSAAFAVCLALVLPASSSYAAGDAQAKAATHKSSKAGKKD